MEGPVKCRSIHAEKAAVRRSHSAVAEAARQEAVLLFSGWSLFLDSNHFEDPFDQSRLRQPSGSILAAFHFDSEVFVEVAFVS